MIPKQIQLKEGFCLNNGFGKCQQYGMQAIESTNWFTICISQKLYNNNCSVVLNFLGIPATKEVQSIRKQ